MKKITDYDYNDKKVILRCDLNVTIKNGKILSDEKIIKSLKTINYLISQNAKVIIMSHMGKIKTEEDKKNKSLYLVYERLSKLLDTNVYFSSATSGKILEDKINMLKNKDVLLVENTRFEDINEKKESKCDESLSSYWASLADIFVNDAFGLSHRRHASNFGISKYLPNCIGFLMEEEIKNLKLLKDPERNYIIIMGGAKIEDKLNVIKDILPKCDYLLLGGAIANSFLKVNYNIGKSLHNNECLDELKELLTTYQQKIILPVDVKVLNSNVIYNKEIKNIDTEDVIYDIGNETIELYKKYINKAKTIFINGTVGKYEDYGFEKGTKSILEAISLSKATTVIGGGDALTSAKHFNISDFTYISTGGGATLEYIATNKLNCFEE